MSSALLGVVGVLTDDDPGLTGTALFVAVCVVLKLVVCVNFDDLLPFFQG